MSEIHPSPNPTGDDEGLRERKKRETRRSLHRAAIQLVTERGLAAVTAEDVARAAGVSTRTFFNYFPTKEAALTGLPEVFAEKMVAFVAGRPDEEPLWQTCRGLATMLCDAAIADEANWLARRTLMDARPEVAPLVLGGKRTLELAVVEAFNQRAGHLHAHHPGWQPRMMALTMLDALRVATHQATSAAELRTGLDEILDALEPVYA